MRSISEKQDRLRFFLNFKKESNLPEFSEGGTGIYRGRERKGECKRSIEVEIDEKTWKGKNKGRYCESGEGEQKKVASSGECVVRV